MIFFVGSIWESERTAISSVFWRVFVTSSDILFYVRYKGVFGAGRGNSVITSVSVSQEIFIKLCSGSKTVQDMLRFL